MAYENEKYMFKNVSNDLYLYLYIYGTAKEGTRVIGSPTPFVWYIVPDSMITDTFRIVVPYTKINVDLHTGNSSPGTLIHLSYKRDARYWRFEKEPTGAQETVVGLTLVRSIAALISPANISKVFNSIPNIFSCGETPSDTQRFPAVTGLYGDVSRPHGQYVICFYDGPFGNVIRGHSAERGISRHFYRRTCAQQVSSEDMMRTLFYLALALALSLALPQRAKDFVEECPEIVPGPGLPSLASLNLTSADLCKPPQEFMMARYGRVDPLFESKEKDPRQVNNWCGSAFISLSKSQYCYNYLYALGNTACVVPMWTRTRFCHTTGNGNEVAWYGNTVDGTQSQSSCRDVALGGRQVLDNCVLHNTPLGAMHREGE
ncbi:hypothetical protein CC2G_013469 [Coprinopsis cinerea AmutBmut pab1-1]|nr:hypothetical protein CC2G_013469 [Coprinopsis cinerea AmutBmut pab1-1]